MATDKKFIPEELLTRRETAVYLRCGLSKVQQLISNGTLPSAKLGGQRLVRKSALNELISSLETEGVVRNSAQELQGLLEKLNSTIERSRLCK